MCLLARITKITRHDVKQTCVAQGFNHRDAGDKIDPMAFHVFHAICCTDQIYAQLQDKYATDCEVQADKDLSSFLTDWKEQ